MGEARKPVRVGDAAELRALRGHRLVWEWAKIVIVEDDYIVFENAEGQRPAYGYDDEGRAWRRGGWVTCAVCHGMGQVPAPATETT